MGLDMYLFKRNKQNPDEEMKEVAYWRKANQIRNWIVEHTDYNINSNCEDYLLNKDILENLIADCKTVIENPIMADNIMPTKSGFFFGDTNYDNWYFAELKDTIKQVEKVIKETDWDNEDIYYYEWW